MNNVTIFDVETTRFPSGNPSTEGTFLVSWAIRWGVEVTKTGYYQDADFLQRLREIICTATMVVGINLKFDISWLTKHEIKLPHGCRVWDCQIAEYVLSGQTNSFASMDELCALYGIKGKEGGLEEYWDKGINTQDIPRDVVLQYNSDDITRTELIFEAQRKDKRMSPELYKLILLMGADLLILEQMESNGLKYDIKRSLEEAEKCRIELKEIENQLNIYAGTTEINWDSGDHLSCFIYGGGFNIDYYVPVESVYKSGGRKGEAYVSNKFKETKRYEFAGYFRPLENTEVKKSTPEQRLYQVGEPVLLQLVKRTKVQKHIIELLLKRSELEKLVGTYFEKIPKMLEEKKWGDIVHGTYNQVVARTGRLSSSTPNMQNNPEVVDRMFITRF